MKLQTCGSTVNSNGRMSVCITVATNYEETELNAYGHTQSDENLGYPTVFKLGIPTVFQFGHPHSLQIWAPPHSSNLGTPTVFKFGPAITQSSNLGTPTAFVLKQVMLTESDENLGTSTAIQYGQSLKEVKT